MPWTTSWALHRKWIITDIKTPDYRRWQSGVLLGEAKLTLISGLELTLTQKVPKTQENTQ